MKQTEYYVFDEEAKAAQALATINTRLGLPTKHTKTYAYPYKAKRPERDPESEEKTYSTVFLLERTESSSPHEDDIDFDAVASGRAFDELQQL